MSRRPHAVWSLVALLALLVVGALVGGLSFVRDPTGASLGAKLSWLEHTPVSDFWLPGLFLLGVYAIGGVAVIAGLIWWRARGPSSNFDRMLGHHWAWAGSIAIGAILVAWIVYELLVLPETTFLQPVLVVVGLAIAALPMMPSMRRWYRVD